MSNQVIRYQLTIQSSQTINLPTTWVFRSMRQTDWNKMELYIEGDPAIGSVSHTLSVYATGATLPSVNLGTYIGSIQVNCLSGDPDPYACQHAYLY